MIFNSLDFLLFFLFVTTFYFLFPHRYRWILLLVASCYFYMALIPIYILILFFTIAVDYFAAIWIEKEKNKKKKKFYLIISIITTCLILFVFKYFNFFNELFYFFSQVFHFHHPIKNLDIILPIGLSFHTFQSLSYVIEVYRGNQKAEKNFGIYSLYVMFYPQLVAGPIERPQNLLHQFYERHSFNYQRVSNGLKLMLWGFFKKVVIADRLAIYVNGVYDNLPGYEGIPLLIAAYFFTIQIYCDFSGYTDIARGAAQIMGFRLMLNFDRPYFSKSIREFWSRWHISLSTWFRDYLYIPLGGNRVSTSRWYFNLFIVFLISGLWHGANWTFVIWGALHGTYLIVEIITKKPRTWVLKITGIKSNSFFNKLISAFITFHLVVLAWIFFRANTVYDAWYVIKNIFNWNAITHQLTALEQIKEIIRLNGVFSGWDFMIALVAILFMERIHWIERKKKLVDFISQKPNWIRYSFYYFLLLFIILCGVFGKQEFIYFQF